MYHLRTPNLSSSRMSERYLVSCRYFISFNSFFWSSLLGALTLVVRERN